MTVLDLLNCPFCGAAPEIIIDTDDGGRFAAVACLKCGAGSRQHYFCGEDAREYAAGAWNTRTPSEVRPEIRLKTLAIRKGMAPDRVWLERINGDSDGEGGDFDSVDVDALLSDFYDDNF